MFVRTALAVLATALIIETGTSLAQSAPPAPAPPPAAASAGPGHHRGFAKLLQPLNLTPDQSAKITAIVQKYRAQNANVTDPQQRHANMHAQRQEIMAVLTPDQQAKLQQEIQQLREHHREGALPAPAPTR